MIMKVHELFVKGSDFFKGVVVGSPLKVRNAYSASDLDDALKRKPTRQTITIKNGVTGEIVGKRTIWQA